MRLFTKSIDNTVLYYCIYAKRDMDRETKTAHSEYISIASAVIFKMLKKICKLPPPAGYVVVIICSLAMQFSNISQVGFLQKYQDKSSRTAMVIGQGLMFLCFPLLGHLADVRFTRYRTIKGSFVTLLVGQGIGMVYLLVAAIVVFALGDDSFTTHVNTAYAVVGVVGAGLMIIGEGIFEASAIQFGQDQLLEAPTPKLISFIHWYYWSQNVGQLVLFYTVTVWLAILPCKYQENHGVNFLSVSILLGLLCCSTGLGLLLVSCSKSNLYNEQAGLNPFKNIYKVLKYSWNHKIPENRSAFTYWEEDIPPRIDLGKNKYGGPFTNEEVEDTKTFLRILPLLLCLFGYHLAGDGFSAPEQLQRTSCPSLPVLLLIVGNPLNISSLVTVVGIPLYRLVITKLCVRINNVLMLTKMWIGLYLSLVQVVIYIVLVLNHDSSYWEQSHTQYISLYQGSSSTINNCYLVRKGTKNCTYFADPVDNTYLWFIIPQLLNGLSSLLVSMTVFEFISAQAPRTTRGLLIGLWYATFSIRLLVVGILNNYITERRSWLISEGVKGILILVSLVLFSCVSKHYRYRQRDEIVNVQGMIEDAYEKWFKQEEEYMQERRAILTKQGQQ